MLLRVVGVCCTLATLAPFAHADQIAVDPNTYYVAPPAEEHVPDESMVVTASATQAWLSQPGGLEAAMRGGTVGFSWLQRDGEFPTGAEATGVFLFGDRASTYALSLRLIGSPEIGKRMLVPYAAVGLAVGASRVVDARSAAMEVDPEPNASYGFAIGPSAAVGLHGFLGNKLYWRAGAGFVAAGIGAVTADLGVGFVVD